MPSDGEVSDNAEERARRILETAPDAMVIVDGDQRIVYANEQTENLFGYSRPQLLGQPLALLVPERLRASHETHVRRYFARPNVRPMNAALDLLGRRADGTELPIEVSLSPLPSPSGLCVCAAIRDVTERKRIEATVALASERLASAIESIQDAFALFDAEGRLVRCNSVYRRLLSESVGPVLRQEYAALASAVAGRLFFHQEQHRDCFLDAFRRLRAGNECASADVHTTDGRFLRVSSRRTPEGGLVQTFWDLTEDRRYEQELLQARAAAEAGSNAKTEFLSSMSHELRTPLNAVLGFAQLLRRDRREPLSPRHLERVEQILRGGEHLLRLIDDILDLSQIETGRMSVTLGRFSLPELLEEVRETLHPLARNSSVSLHLEAAEGLPLVLVDRTRFVQILMNLGSNAIKYNREGGSVTLRAAVCGLQRVRVTVEDTGIGIPLEMQDKLFQPFQRAGQETGPIEGTGIGLMITRRLAAMMHGSVGFRSEPGRGSEFWVEVPTAPEQDRSERPPPEEKPSGSLAPDRSRVVLYVEDNPANVAFVRDLLGSYEHLELLSAGTAEEGLALANRHLPAVILMDINLPGMSGAEALAALQHNPRTAAIPVIALTAAAAERDRKRGESLGFYRYLTKPLRVEDLESALSEAFALSALGD